MAAVRTLGVVGKLGIRLAALKSLLDPAECPFGPDVHVAQARHRMDRFTEAHLAGSASLRELFLEGICGYRPNS